MKRRFSYSAKVPVEFEQACSVMAGHAPLQLRRTGAEMTQESRLLTRFEFELKEGSTVSHKVAVRFGDLERMPDSATMSVHVEAQDHRAAFPKLDGLLRFAPVETVSIDVVFTGSYSPPFGIVGLVGDLLGGAKHARESIDGFFTELTTRVRLQAEKPVNEVIGPTPRPDDFRGGPML